MSLAVALAVAEFFALQHPLIAANPNFSLIVTLDLAVALPAVCFLLVRRRRPLAWQTLIPYMLLGGFVSALLLRDAQIVRGLFLLELLSLTFFISKIIPFVSRVRGDLQAGEPLEQALQRGLEAAYGGSPAMPVLRLALTEMFLIYYGIFGSFRRTPKASPERPDIFSYHRSQDTGMSLALMLILTLEAVPVHFLVHQWSNIAAWVLTGLSLYTLLWLLGDLQALRLKPAKLTATHLHLYTGLRQQATIPLEDIADITPAEPTVPAGCTQFSLSEPAQLYLYLKRPAPVFGLFGKRTDVSCIGVYVDDPERFQICIQSLFTTGL